MNKIFHEKEIIDLYNNYVDKKNNNYLYKNFNLPLNLNDKNWKWEGKDFPRVMCVLDFREWINKINQSYFENILVTDITDPELEFVNYKNIDFIPYNNGKNDLHTLDLTNKEYDFILINQTIEHLYNPFIALEKIYNHLKPGGYFFTSVPTINIPHMTPFHFNGYTPMGLLLLLKSVGFQIIELGFWGNNDYIDYIFKNHYWPDYRQLIKNGTITNEQKNVAQTWALVKK